MATTRRLAVGLPVYNGENYLDEALTAIRAQTFGDFTLVVSDNASTDSTPDIVARHTDEDDRIVVLRHPENLGAAPNYNAAYHRAPPSELFCWIAHDDRPDPRFFEECVAALDADPEAVLAFSRVMLIDGYGNDLGHAPHRPKLSSPSAHVRLSDAIDQRKGNEPVFGVIRRRALERTGLHGSYTGSDRTLLAELAMLGHYLEVPELLFAVREHPQRSVRGKRGFGEQTREGWFDTSRAGRIVFPRWKRLRGYVRAVVGAPVPPAEKGRCFGALGRWLLDGNWKTLGFDLTVAGKQITRRVAGRLPGR